MKKVLALVLVTVMIAVMIPVVSVAAPDADTPFYTYIDGSSEFKQLIGWWLHPVQWDNLRTIDIDFTTPNAFDGFGITCQAGGPSMRIQLYGPSLKEEVVQTIVEGYNFVTFTEAHPAGSYRLRFTWEGTDPNQHFVIRAAEKSGLVTYTVSGGVNNSAGQFTSPAPAISLRGAEYTGPASEIDRLVYDRTDTVGLGFGITTAGQSINISFSTTTAFGGFKAFFYVAESVADIILLDNAGNVLETIPAYSFTSGDTMYMFCFSRAYGPGEYTIKIAFVSANPHLILGQATYPGDLTTFSVSGTMSLNMGGVPFMMLLGDVSPSVIHKLYAGTITTGWWFHNNKPDGEDDRHITVSFNADSWFDRMEIAVYGTGTVNMELSAENGNVVDNVSFTARFGDDPFAFVYFSRPHAPGRYVLNITPGANVVNNGAYFIVGTGAQDDMRASVSANVYEAARTIAPAIALVGETAYQPVLELSKVNVSLTDGNLISINFKADKSLFLDSDDGSNIVTFSYEGITKDVEGVVSGDNLVFTLSGLSPDEINTTIVATLETKVGGVRRGAPIITFKPKTYFQNLETNGTPNLQSLAAATLNYAGAAQAFKGEVVTIDPVDTAHLPATRAYTDSKSLTAISAAEKKASWKAVGLKLEDEVMIRYTFTLDAAVDPDDVTVKFTYDGSLQRTLTIANCTATATAGRYMCYLPMPANKLSTEVTAQIFEGTTGISSALVYSVESYAAAKANGGDALANLVVAMMQYGDAAAAYVADPNA